MADPTIELRDELNVLLRLTTVEARVSELRLAQARGPRVATTISRSAGESHDRIGRLAQAVRDLGGVPDVVGAAIARTVAAARIELERGQSPVEALLGDLSRQHELLDRARYARVLADNARAEATVALMHHLEMVHSTKVERLEIRLSEVAVGEPAPLRPTSVHRAVDLTRQVVSFPVRQAMRSLNLTVAVVDGWREAAERSAATALERARHAAEVASDGAGGVWRYRLGAVGLRSVPLRRPRRDGGVPEGYDDLTVPDVARLLQGLDDAGAVAAVADYEKAHKDRKGVADAATVRLRELGAVAEAS